MFFIIGNWQLADGGIDSDEIANVAAQVRQQHGVLDDRWRQDPDDAERALALVIIDDESSVRTVVNTLRTQIPTADLRMIRVLAHS